MGSHRRKEIMIRLLIVIGILGFALACAHVETADQGPVRNVASNPVGVAYEMSESIQITIRRSAHDFIEIPKSWIMKAVIDWKAGDYIDSLDLPSDTKQRVKAVIEKDEMVSEVVPFLLAMKNHYTIDDGAKSLGFDVYARKQFRNLKVPGLEHSNFKFQEEAKGESAFKMDKKLVRNIVILYDALFLKKGRSPLKFSSLDKSNDDFVRSVVPEGMPYVRTLLKDLAAAMRDGDDKSGNAETAKGLEAIADDNTRLQTITITLVDAVTQTLSDTYKMYQSQYVRYLILKDYLTKSLNNKKFDEVIAYLDQANRSRRYAAHITVDGLQGNLVENLSAGNPGNSFLKQIWHDHQKLRRAAKPSETSSHLDSSQVTFLPYAAKYGIKDVHYLSYFKNLYSRYRNTIAKVGVSTTPTISVRNLPIIQTGSPVAGPFSTGIPNFHFVDRPSGRPYYFWGNDAIMLGNMTKESGMRTMFERLPGQTALNCNAQFDYGATMSMNAFFNIAAGEKKRDIGEVFCLSELKRRARTEKQLRGWRSELSQKIRAFRGSSLTDKAFKYFAKGNAEALIEQIATQETNGFPTYFLFYSPWPDHFAHFKSPFSDEIISPTGELNRLNYWLAQIQSVYDDLDITDRTLFGMAGDHGLTPIYNFLNPDTDVFEKMQESGIKLNVMKISSDEGEGPKMNNRLQPPSLKGVDVVVASTAGGNYMVDLFVQDDWKRQPVEADLMKLRTVAGQEVNFISEILNRLKTSLDYLVYRKSLCDYQECTVVAKGWRDEGVASITIQRQLASDGQKMRIVEAQGDLLGLKKLGTYAGFKRTDLSENLYNRCVKSQAWCKDSEWRELTSFTDRPDSVVQLSHLYDHDRAGTINLFPLPGIGYNTKVPGRHAGEHFHEKDAFVGIWGAPVSSGYPRRIRSAVNGSVPVSIYEFLSGKKVVPYHDGWGYESLLK